MKFWQKVNFAWRHPQQTLKILAFKYLHWREKRELIRNLSTSLSAKIKRHRYYNSIGEAFPGCPNGTEHVVDLGCGPGRYVGLLHSFGYQVTGVDLQRYHQWQWFPQDRLMFMSDISIEALPFPDGHFDHGICIGTLFYCDNPEKAVDELVRVVKPGGRIVISTINSHSEHACANKVAERGTDAYANLETLLKKTGLNIEEQFLYGFAPSYAKRLFSLAYYTVMPIWFYDLLNRITRKEHKPIITFFCTKPS